MADLLPAATAVIGNYVLIDLLRLLARRIDAATILAGFLLVSAIATGLGRRRLALLLQIVLLAIVIFLGVFPGGAWLAHPLETRFPSSRALPAEVAGIIALGGTERVSQSAASGQPTLSDATPIVEMVVLSNRFPNAKLVFTGGSHPPNAPSPTEADIVRGFLHGLRVDDSRVIYEARSQNTYENAIFSRELVHPTADEHWLLLAQAISLPRAVGVFRRAGWNVTPVPSGYLSIGTTAGFFQPINLLGQLRLASIALHEWGGLVVYWLAGYTDALFPE